MKNIRWFYILYAVFLMLLGGLILSNSRGELHQFLTLDWLQKQDEGTIWVSDIFFKYITEIGSSIPFVTAVFFLFIRFGYSYFLLLTQIVVTLIVQPLKWWLNAPRPKVFFAENFPDVVLHQVDGVPLHVMHSFPSGHTAAAFSFMLCLAFLANKTSVSIICLLVAVVTAYSRIYLSQHFAEDVFVGSVIGVLVTTCVYFFYMQKTFGWQQQSLLTTLKNNKNKQ